MALQKSKLHSYNTAGLCGFHDMDLQPILTFHIRRMLHLMFHFFISSCLDLYVKGDLQNTNIQYMAKENSEKRIKKTSLFYFLLFLFGNTSNLKKRTKAAVVWKVKERYPSHCNDDLKL